MKKFQESKRAMLAYMEAMERARPEEAGEVLASYMTPDCQWMGFFPFEERAGAQEVAETFWTPLKRSLAFLQRRQDIFLAGKNLAADGEEVWAVSMGYFVGNFVGDFLGLPPTGRIANLRYAEFNRMEEDGRISRSALFVDLIGLLDQMGENPLPKQLGTIFRYPGPREQNGILLGEQDPKETEKTRLLVNRMFQATIPYNDVLDSMPHEVLAQNWAEDMMWYAPAGAGYTIDEFRRHQLDFRCNLVERQTYPDTCLIAEGNFLCLVGYPCLSNISKGGYLGLPATNTRADMRIADIYCRRGDKLSENWVFSDIPYWLKQCGLDIFERARWIR